MAIWCIKATTPIEEIQLEADLSIPGANMDLMSFNASIMHEGQDFQVQMGFENLSNYTWDFNIKGGLDLGKIFQIIPLRVYLKGLILEILNQQVMYFN